MSVLPDLLTAHGLTGGGGGATIKAIYQGDSVYNNTSSSLVTIGATIDPAKSILLFTPNYSGFSLASGVRGRISSTTQINFQSANGATVSGNIRWTVVEFASGVKVQHLSGIEPMDTLDVTITAVNTAKTFVLNNGHSTSNSNNRIDWIPRPYLLSSTVVRFAMPSAANSQITSNASVVEFT